MLHEEDVYKRQEFNHTIIGILSRFMRGHKPKMIRHNHVAIGAADIEICTQRSGQGLFDQIDPAGASLHGRLDDRPLLNFGDAAGHADDDPGLDQRVAHDLLEKGRQHLLGHVVIRSEERRVGKECRL